MTSVNGFEHGDSARPVVKLEQAFGWSCPDCNTRNYVEAEAVAFENDEERRAAYRELGMLEDWEELPSPDEGRFLMAPSTVRCSKCRRKYPSVDEDEDAVELEGPDDL